MSSLRDLEKWTAEIKFFHCKKFVRFTGNTLNETTSALDNKSEAIVQQAIENLMVDKTMLIIAYRLSTIKNVDKIAFLQEGRLVEFGTHEELMQIPDGYYKSLYELQFKKY